MLVFEKDLIFIDASILRSIFNTKSPKTTPLKGYNDVIFCIFTSWTLGLTGDFKMLLTLFKWYPIFIKCPWSYRFLLNNEQAQSKLKVQWKGAKS